MLLQSALPWLSAPAPRQPLRQSQHRTGFLVCRCLAHKPGPVETPPPGDLSRRAALAVVLSAPAALAAAAVPSARASPTAFAADALTVEQLFPGSSQGALTADGELRFSHKVYMDIGQCVGGARQDRKLGDKSVLCTEPEPLGRLVIGLYGTIVPQTVSNFLKAVEAGAYNNTLLSKVLPGQYIVGGRQGPHRNGYVEAPAGLPSNGDLLDPLAFQLEHRRPGTVSLNLSANEDEDYLRLGKDYRNLSFLITTGPGPVPSLDGENIVMGQVIEGLDVVSSIAAVPTFSPDQKLKAFNEFAKALGDDRAAKARQNWGKPIAPVVIVAAGVLPQ